MGQQVIGNVQLQPGHQHGGQFRPRSRESDEAALATQCRRPASSPGRAGATRIWGRRYHGPHPGGGARLVVALVAIGVLPRVREAAAWSSPGYYSLTATFENAATLRETAPVRIAGVNVGRSPRSTRPATTAKVTFTVADEGRPIHSDAEIDIRPRLFLEGNFFLDLRPGSPSAPGSRTAARSDHADRHRGPARRGAHRPAGTSAPRAQRLLEGFGTALTYEPTPADDVTQDVIVQGETAAESLNDAFRYGGPAGRSTAIVADALRGEEPRDLARLIRPRASSSPSWLAHEADLQDLITNLNVTAGAFARVGEPLPIRSSSWRRRCRRARTRWRRLRTR